LKEVKKVLIEEPDEERMNTGYMGRKGSSFFIDQT